MCMLCWRAWAPVEASLCKIQHPHPGSSRQQSEKASGHSLCLPAQLLQSCPTLCDPVDGHLPGSSVHGILRARILEWVAISYSRGSSWPRDQTRVSCGSGIAGVFFTAEPVFPQFPQGGVKTVGNGYSLTFPETIYSRPSFYNRSTNGAEVVVICPKSQRKIGARLGAELRPLSPWAPAVLTQDNMGFHSLLWKSSYEING